MKWQFGNVMLDSNEELYMAWWLDELQQAGFVKKWCRAASYDLSKEAIVTVCRPGKRKQLTRLKKILAEHRYTPDFLVEWERNAADIFVAGRPSAPLLTSRFLEGALADSAALDTLIEVKPAYDGHNMTRLFRINQKWMLDKHGLFVNLVIPAKLFEVTFTPLRFLMTDKTMKQRKLKKAWRSLDEYVNQCTAARKATGI